MPKIRSVGDDIRVLADGREVRPDEVFEVPEDDVPGFECQPRLWRVESGRKAAIKDEVA